MKIKFKHDKDCSVFQSEWHIYIDNRYEGFIYKIKKLSHWCVFSSKLGITPTKNNDKFKSIYEAKQFVLKMGELI